MPSIFDQLEITISQTFVSSTAETKTTLACSQLNAAAHYLCRHTGYLLPDRSVTLLTDPSILRAGTGFDGE